MSGVLKFCQSRRFKQWRTCFTFGWSEKINGLLTSVMYIQPETPYWVHSRKDGLKNESNYFCSVDISKALQSFRYLWWCRARKWITCSGSKCLVSFTTTSSQSKSFSTISLCSSHFSTVCPLCLFNTIYLLYFYDMDCMSKIMNQCTDWLIDWFTFCRQTVPQTVDNW